MLVAIVNDVSVGSKRGNVKSEKESRQKMTITNQAGNWRQFNYPANFLKHVDRDPGEALALDKVNNEMLLMLRSPRS
jgi:hypothetical protein